jgi:hypothetical protein
MLVTDKKKCRECGINVVYSKGRSRVTGNQLTSSLCRVCTGHQSRSDKRRRPWIVHKKGYCEQCGFIPVHSCQLDVDHKDGNRKNNDPSNYVTLCANCHRLKTFVNKDWQLNVVVL